MEVVKLQKSKELYDDTIISFIKIYNETGLPIEVSFRELNTALNNSDRSTHLIHTYPAKLLPHIPYIFLNNSIYSSKGDLILDPFCGSGTVLLEAILAGRNAVGLDSNPLARLITRVKTTKYNLNHLNDVLTIIVNQYNSQNKTEIPNVINIDNWFLKEIKESLGKLKHIITGIDDHKARDFFLLCFSNCVKKVSLADPRVSVPVKLRLDQYKIDHPLRKKTKTRLENLKKINVLEKFVQISKENIKRFNNLRPANNITAKVIGNDARKIKKSINGTVLKESNSVDLILTSPPYGGAQKYIRASSLNLGWLGELTERTLVAFEKESIGREHYRVHEYKELAKTGVTEADCVLTEIFKKNPLRAHIAGNYLIEMKQALQEMYRVLKPDGFLILIAANNYVCGKEFETQFFLKKICLELGFSISLELVDDIKSYGLMTKRNKTASVITREWVLIFKK